jgi:hypothetical protein
MPAFVVQKPETVRSRKLKKNARPGAKSGTASGVPAAGSGTLDAAISPVYPDRADAALNGGYS